MSTVLPQAPDSAAYRELIDYCLVNAPDFSGVTEIADLPELEPADFEVILARHPDYLTEVSMVEEFQHALLEDVQHEWELRNERRAQARDEDLYGADSPQTERERMEVEFGVRGLFR